RPAQPVQFAYQQLDLSLTQLSSSPGAQAELQLQARGEQGGQLDWQGALSINPLQSSGQLSLQQAPLAVFAPYLSEQLPLNISAGALTLSSHYQFSLQPELQLVLDTLALQLAGLAVHDAAGQPLLSLAQAELTDSHLDLAGRQLQLGRLDSQGLVSRAAREADGSIDWLRHVSRKAGAGDNPPEPGEQAAGATWQVSLKQALLRDHRVQLSDRAAGKQAVELSVDAQTIELHDFDSRGETPFKLTVDSQLGPRGRLQADASIQLKPLKISAKTLSSDIDLRLAQTYIEPFIRLELRSGLLSSTLAVELDGLQPLQLRVSGQAGISQLHSVDGLKQRDFVRWQNLQVDGIDYRHGQRLEIAGIHLKQPYARLVINENFSTNIGELLIAQPQSSGTPPAASAPLALRIGGIRIEDGSANFADFSLRPSFATAIQQLNGNIGELTNQGKNAASVNIQGKVDKYAPVSIKGQLTPFDPLHRLDIATAFDNVELTTLTPYSGKFAGYRIRKGRLSLALHYRIDQGRLNAENRLKLEDLQLGEQVDSKDAVDLPVRLAVALLKDTRGNIELSLPVQGNLNDPQFSIMPIVWQTLRNLVLRAAQAPFTFIAGLAGGASADLSQVQFAAGSAQLDGAARRNLDSLVSALNERPALRLEVEGSSVRASDGPLLAEQRLEREYRLTQYRSLQRQGEKLPASAEQLQLSDSDKAALLEGIYRSRLKQQPPAEWSALEADERIQRMHAAVVQSWAGNEVLLRRLAQSRAAQIKDYLVEKGLEDSRVLLIDVGVQDSPASAQVATQLHLGSL
ncbi:TPA: DUF748 domain-containing protein, partial [Klebsiella pneumoniae]